MAIPLGSSGFAEFDRLRQLFGATRAVLEAFLTTGDLPDTSSELVATEALSHVEDVEAGFRAWLRAGEAGVAELRQLVLHGGLGPQPAINAAEERAALAEALMARTGAGGERQLDPDPSRRLAALTHARLVFAMLPRTPNDQVRFPAGRRTYADIAAPHSPGELAGRIEELERELWWVAAGRPPRRANEAYRRTYGFFDAAEQLAGQGLHPG